MSTPAQNLPLFPKEISKEDPFFFEILARNSGYKLVAGVDEVGRGPLAGPVVAAAVILGERSLLEEVRDSKKMSPTAREKAFSRIINEAVSVGIGVISPREIDKINIKNGSLEAMKKALLALSPRPEFLLIDGIHAVAAGIPQRCIRKGDQLSKSISAASVVAKVYRDRMMCSYSRLYPAYGFHRNKGYGTPEHLEAIRQWGPCPVHRLTFKGVH